MNRPTTRLKKIVNIALWELTKQGNCGKILEYKV